MMNEYEWLETDGLGGFAMGTTSQIPRRKYHSLLITSTKPPTHRFNLVNAVEVYLNYNGKRHPLSSLMYEGETIHPEGYKNIAKFHATPWPTWVYQPEGSQYTVEHELFMRKGAPMVVLSWKCRGIKEKAWLEVRPLLSVRDYHELHHSNENFHFTTTQTKNCVEWSPYPGAPSISAYSNAHYSNEPDWYYNFHYSEEKARGFDAEEDLACPGVFKWELTNEKEAYLIFVGSDKGDHSSLHDCSPEKTVKTLRAQELKRRKAFPSPLFKAADDYVVTRGDGKTIIAGYPWFTDWGRDTFIAYRGICISTGNIEAAKQVIDTWGKTISQGMIPNRFPDSGSSADYNAVDASLWFVSGAYTLLSELKGKEHKEYRDSLKDMILQIVNGYYEGTRFRIRCDNDCLLKAGLEGTQLTWMDAKVGPVTFTSRVGKPVEVQALWINALKIASKYEKKFTQVYEKACSSFEEKFWNEDEEILYDVVDVNHEPGVVDPSFRPNQVFAIGGLPFQVLKGKKARSVIDKVEEKLLTPVGMRTLSPDDPRYCSHYEGKAFDRDKAYHNGTAWPWLLGGFIEAWVRVRRNSSKAKEDAFSHFVKPILETYKTENGLLHISEIHDGSEPFRGNGCPFQAWSVAEIIRVCADILEVDLGRIDG